MPTPHRIAGERQSETPNRPQLLWRSMARHINGHNDNWAHKSIRDPGTEKYVSANHPVNLSLFDRSA